MHVFQYSSRPIFNSDQHVPATQELWCKKSDEAARSQGAGRGADWTSVALNNRGKERQPIRLSIHLFGRSRYAAVLRAATYTSSSAEPITQTDPRVVRLLEVEGAPVSFHAVLLPSSFPATRPSRTPFPGQQHAVERTLRSCISPWLAPIPLDSSLELCVGQAQTSVQLRHWMDSWWQIEDSALWCLLGHVWQLANPGSAGEAEARQAAGVARRNRLAAEARLHAEQMRLQAGLDPDAAEQEQVTD